MTLYKMFGCRIYASFSARRNRDEATKLVGVTGLDYAYLNADKLVTLGFETD